MARTTPHPAKKPATRPELCGYCNGTKVGSYWVHSLEYTLDFPCHACDGKGAIASSRRAMSARRDATT